MTELHLAYVFKRVSLTLWLSIFFVVTVFGQSTLFDDSECDSSFRFFYSLGVSGFSPDFADTSSAFSRMDTFIRFMKDHPGRRIIRIRISGFASIEGNYASNEALARSRVEQFYIYLHRLYPTLKAYPCNLAWVAEDWVTLSGLVRNSEINEREEILHIIRHVPSFEDREQLLRRLNGGRAYSALEQTIFPSLRRVEIEFECGPVEMDSVATVPSSPLVYSVTEKKKEEERKEEKEHAFDPSQKPLLVHASPKYSSHVPHRFALKTNLLQWVGVQSNFKHTTSLSNVALECFFASHWSAELGIVYSYWLYDGNRKFQGISGYRVEVRRFIPVADNRLDMFLGLYGRVGDYDIRKDRNAVNYTGDYWDTGLSTGLSIPLVSGFYLEVGARVGYLRTNVIKYRIDGSDNLFDGRSRYSRLRVAETGVSLAYRFR